MYVLYKIIEINFLHKPDNTKLQLKADIIAGLQCASSDFRAHIQIISIMPARLSR